MFTEILNIVVLLAKPTVVIVIVQAANCCYCSDPLTVVNVRSASAENTAVENTAVFYCRRLQRPCPRGYGQP